MFRVFMFASWQSMTSQKELGLGLGSYPQHSLPQTECRLTSTQLLQVYDKQD